MVIHMHNVNAPVMCLYTALGLVKLARMPEPKEWPTPLCLRPLHGMVASMTPMMFQYAVPTWQVSVCACVSACNRMQRKQLHTA